MANLDLLLIAPYAYFHTVPGTTPPCGIAYIASYLINKGYDVNLIDADISRTKNEEVLTEILQKKPRLIGITVNLMTVKSSLQLIRLIRQKTDIPMILGGPFASSSPDHLLERTTGTIGAVMGEGETAVHKILQNLDQEKFIFDGLVNVSYRNNNGGIVKFQHFTRIQDLDSLPFPAWHLFGDLKKYNMRARKIPSLPIITSRGCIHKCTFCSRPGFDSKITIRSPQNVVEEVDWAIKTFRARQFDFMDDDFSENIKRAHKIFDLLLKRRRNISINIQHMRADRVDEELVVKMKKAGVYRVAFGIENGDEEHLKRMNKRLDLNIVILATRLAKKNGIIVYGDFILGMPGESRQSMLNTIKFAKKLNPTFANFMIATPMPGSQLFDEVKQRGKMLVDIEGGLSSAYQRGEVYFEIDGLRKEDVSYCHGKAYMSFYLRPKKIVEVLLSLRSRTEWKWFFEQLYFFLKAGIENVRRY